MMFVSAVVGTVLIALGSNFVVPVGAAVGGIFDLAGIALMIMFFGLIEGEGAKSDE
jgi:hypothetical protein